MNEQQIKDWMARDPDPETREEVNALLEAGDHEGLVERFLGRLEFGTAGLRGVLGGGPNRMNRLVVIESSLGFGRYVMETVDNAAERGIVIAYDGRRKSDVFARDAAAAFAHVGLNVHLFPREMPTPAGAFAVKHLDAAAGVIITASHNPPEYNGYKAYWENGAQIISPVDTGVAKAIDQVAKDPLPEMSFEAARSSGRVTLIDESVIGAYLDGVAGQLIHGSEGDRSLSVAYTPLHGVGAELASKAMTRAGFENFVIAESQREPDGEFPTVRFPNPEEPGAMDAVLALAEESGADIAFANDPDADRLAVAVRDGDAFRMLTGDEIGTLLASDLLSQAPKDSAVATTIVSSSLLGRMAESRGVAYFETLTGFKWIANGNIERQKRGETFLFGYEEALGYTIGDNVRDKDGIVAMVAFAEMTAVLRAQGRSVLDQLYDVYREHGVVVTKQKSLRLPPGPPVGRTLRAHPPTAIGGRAIVETDDLAAQTRTRADGTSSSLELPPSDVLVYRLDGDARVIVRPSGTEPKLKCYYLVRRAVDGDAREAEHAAHGELDELLAAHQKELATLLS
ncbi:MAG: phospho-sugar mutase [Myxococcota bacterium]